MNRVAKGGYTEHWATADDAADMGEELALAHQEMWKDRGITPAHAEPRFVRFVRTACERMARHGDVGLVRLDAPEDVEDPMVLHNLMVIGRQYIGGWLSANNETARKQLSVAVYEDIQGIELANRVGVGVMSMLRGLESDKIKTADRAKVNHRVLLAGRSVRATGVWLRHAVPAATIARLKHWEQHSERGQRMTDVLRSVRARIRP
jgi:hypothetical protein